MLTNRTRRAKAIAVVSLALGLCIIPMSTAGANPTFSSTRLAGANRYDTAKAVAAAYGSASTVVIARGDDYPDALAGSYLAGNKAAPILLTFTGSLPTETKAALDTMKPTSALILGGTSAVSDAVRNELAGRGITPTRISGTNRYATARAVAESATAAYVGAIDGKKTALLASGENYPDALAAGPASYAGKLPLLLTTKASLHADALAAMKALNVTRVYVLGGTAAIAPAVDAALTAQGIEAIRVAGNNRSQTALQIASDIEYTKLGFRRLHLNLARGDGFADALTGGPHAGKEQAPILLTQSSEDLGTDTSDFVRANTNSLVDGHVFGGSAAVSDAAKGEFDNAGKGLAPSNNVTVTMSKDQTPAGGTVSGTITATATSSRQIQSVSVSGCSLVSQPVTRDSAGRFVLTIPESQRPGRCELTFTTYFTLNQGSENDKTNVTVSGR